MTSHKLILFILFVLIFDMLFQDHNFLFVNINLLCFISFDIALSCIGCHSCIGRNLVRKVMLVIGCRRMKESFSRWKMIFLLRMYQLLLILRNLIYKLLSFFMVSNRWLLIPHALNGLYFSGTRLRVYILFECSQQ